MRWPIYLITEISDKSPEVKRTGIASWNENTLMTWPDVSCHHRVDVFIKAVIFRCQSRPRLTVEVKRSPVNSPYVLIISPTLFLSLSLSLLDSTFIVSWRNKENKLYFLYTSVRHLKKFLLSSLATVCNPVGRTPKAVAVYNTGSNGNQRVTQYFLEL